MIFSPEPAAVVAQVWVRPEAVRQTAAHRAVARRRSADCQNAAIKSTFWRKPSTQLLSHSIPPRCFGAMHQENDSGCLSITPSLYSAAFDRWEDEGYA